VQEPDIEKVRRLSRLLIGLVTLLQEKEKEWEVYSGMIRPLLFQGRTTWDYRITLRSKWIGLQRLQDLGIEQLVGDHRETAADHSGEGSPTGRSRSRNGANEGIARGKANKRTAGQHKGSCTKATEEEACAGHTAAEDSQRQGSCTEGIENIIQSEFASCMAGYEFPDGNIMISVRLEASPHSDTPMIRWQKTYPKEKREDGG
jgi:hypothetical protein